jgi:hypothetical protein
MIAGEYFFPFRCHSGTARSAGPGIQKQAASRLLWIPGSLADARAPE